MTERLAKLDNTTRPIFAAAFPSYRGRIWRLSTAERVYPTDTYWDGGSRSTYVFLRLDTGATLDLPDLISGGYAPGASVALDRARAGYPLSHTVACVRHDITCGKDRGLTLIVHPDCVARLLPAPTSTV